ncbi:MAG: DUF975 family protein, partial [Clostridia bacterium]|nr:DUF975 family protein [Clostridia bacterium]
IMLLIGVCSGAAAGLLSLVPKVGSLISTLIVIPAFTLSTIRVYLMVCRGEKPDAGDAFCGFDDFFSAFKVTFLVGLFTFLWSLLFFIPGIVKAYSYTMSFYILAENKGKGALECINESKAMTDGHKMELFVLDLSFLGWALLCTVTLGIAGIWVIPYYNATQTNAYLFLKETSKENTEASAENNTIEAPQY